MITKKDIQYLSELARLEISLAEEEKILADLEKILNHFEELKEVKADDVEPMTGGTSEKNVFRGDEEDGRLLREKAVAQFPEKERGYLKIPPVFD